MISRQLTSLGRFFYAKLINDKGEAVASTLPNVRPEKAIRDGIALTPYVEHGWAGKAGYQWQDDQPTYAQDGRQVPLYFPLTIQANQTLPGYPGRYTLAFFAFMPAALDYAHALGGFMTPVTGIADWRVAVPVSDNT